MATGKRTLLVRNLGRVYPIITDPKMKPSLKVIFLRHLSTAKGKINRRFDKIKISKVKSSSRIFNGIIGFIKGNIGEPDLRPVAKGIANLLEVVYPPGKLPFLLIEGHLDRISLQNRNSPYFYSLIS